MRVATVRRAVFAFAVGGLLASCAQPPERFPNADDLGPKRAGVSKSLEVHFVDFATNDATLDEQERKELLGFLDSIDAGQRDPISLLLDQSMPDELAMSRRARVSELLRKHGYTAVEPPSATPLETSWRRKERQRSVLVQVLRYHAEASGCPDWSRPKVGGFTNLTSSNFGCATAQNLSRMVAEPRDLEEGRDPGTADGERLGQSIERYRNDNVKFEETDGGGTGAVGTGGGTGQ